MRDPLTRTALLLAIIISFSTLSLAQRRNPPLICKRPALAALKPIPDLSYQCDEQLIDSDEKILKLPARLAALKTLTDQLSSFTEPAWWAQDVTDLNVCDFKEEPGTLNTEQRKIFLNGEYLFRLFGNNHIRLVLIADPCYQTGYGGSNAFLLYRAGARVVVTQVLDGYFSRADNPINVSFAKLNGQEIIEIATWSGGLNSELTNYYFVIDPNSSKTVPRNLFKGSHGPTNEISSAMLFGSTPSAAPLQIIRGNTLAKSFLIYLDDANGKIDDNGRSLSRKLLRWNGKKYR
jgi:hypothetical protein